MKATNLLKLYMNCNFSQCIIETLTMFAPMFGLDKYFTVHRYDIVFFFFFFFFFVVQDHVVTKIRYTSFIPVSENDHSNFYIYSLSLPTGTFAVIKRGVYKSSLFIFHRELYSILSDFSLTS